MAENISVTLTVWKPFFVFVSHGSRGISQLHSQFQCLDGLHTRPSDRIQLKKVVIECKKMKKLLFIEKYVALDIEITKCQNNEMKPKAMSKKVRRIVSCGPLTYIECFQNH